MVEGKLTKTQAGSYRIYLPKILVEEMMGVHKSAKVNISSPEPGKIEISTKEINEELIDVDSDTEEVK